MQIQKLMNFSLFHRNPRLHILDVGSHGSTMNNFASIILKDGTRLEIGTNNLIIVHGTSELINAMLESLNENFYQPEKDQQGKTKMKKITQDRPFKLIKGGKNE